MAVRSIVLAGGCFWGVEELFRALDGVVKTEVGYTGGTTKDPTYKEICTGTTGHAEAIKVDYDDEKSSLESILDFFFKIHDPTTLNRQGNDIGSQYRSAIFASEDQVADSEAAIQRATDSGRWNKKIVTAIEKVSEFYSAEEYHQDYLQKNPGGYTCHFIRD